MKRHFLFTLTVVAAIALVGEFSAPARAQGAPGQGAGRGGGFRGPGGGMRMGMGDPTMSNAMTLLQRDDVRSELKITAKQREDLEAMQTKAGNDFRQQMQANRPDFQSLQNLSPEERQQKMQEFRDQMQNNVRTFMGEMDKKTEAILTPAQLKRLHELDLQWRGPLALGDTKVADQMNLAPAQKTKVAAQVTAYRNAQQEAMRSAFAGGSGGGAPGQNGGGQRPQFDPQAMQARMAEVQKQIEKARKENGDKVLALLTADQKETWKTLQGKPFTFRVAE